MTETPPSARLEVEADVTPGIDRTADSPLPTAPTSGVSNCSEMVVDAAAVAGASPPVSDAPFAAALAETSPSPISIAAASSSSKSARFSSSRLNGS